MNDEYDVNVNIRDDPAVDVQTDITPNVIVNSDGNILIDAEVSPDIDIDAESDDEEQLDVSIDESIGESVADHRRLSHRDEPRQHPISAIDGLNDALSTMQNAIDTGFISASEAISVVAVAASGKNTVFHSSTAPTEQGTGQEFKVGDTWFNSSENYCMYTWNGTQWVREQFGNAAFAHASIWEANIANGAITTAKIADAAITNAKIDSLDVAKLTGGYIDASHIDVSSLDSEYVTQITGKTGIAVHDADDLDNYGLFNSDGVQLYANNAEVATFGASTIELGKNSRTTNITLCGRVATMTADSSGKFQIYAPGDVNFSTYTQWHQRASNNDGEAVNEFYSKCGSHVAYMNIKATSTDDAITCYTSAFKLHGPVQSKTQYSNFNNLFCVGSVSSSETSISAKSNKSFSFSVAKSGYTPIGIIGYQASGTSTSMCNWYRMQLSGSNVDAACRNTDDSAASITLTVTVLYTPNSQGIASI